jgi:hypothetical protein
MNHGERLCVKCGYNVYGGCRCQWEIMEGIMGMEWEKIWCMECGKSVSTAVPKGTIVRAWVWVQCPECLEKEATAKQEITCREDFYKLCRNEFPEIHPLMWQEVFGDKTAEMEVRYFLEKCSQMQTATEWCREQGALPS